MKLSISNIAWNSDEDDLIISLLKKNGINKIEIAPTKFWERPLDTSTYEHDELKRNWGNKGISFIAMQSLLFGQSHLNLFSTVESRNQMLDYLSGIISLAGNLGVKTLVFGSPKNRLVGKLSYKERMEIAAPFFYQLGSFAVKNNVTLCIEPNPIHYGCDFITNTEEALGLIREVNHPGFQLHLDSGALELNDENIYTVIEHSMPYLKHFHISEPYLNLIGSGQTKHREIAIALRSLGYENWISIEMKNSVSPSNIESVERALDYTLETYVQRGAY